MNSEVTFASNEMKIKRYHDTTQCISINNGDNILFFVAIYYIE